MRLSDIMGNLDLSTFPQIGLVLFLAIFAGVAWQVVRPKNGPAFEEARQIPLRDEVER